MSEKGKKPVRIVVLACQQALQAEGVDRLDGFKLVRLPCSAKAEPALVLAAFESGAAGVALVPCAEGACQYLQGNFRARSLAKDVVALISGGGVEAERFALYPLEMDKRTGLNQFLTEFASKVEELGDWQPG